MGVLAPIAPSFDALQGMLFHCKKVLPPKAPLNAVWAAAGFARTLFRGINSHKSR
jgi:hypothetical protein